MESNNIKQERSPIAGVIHVLLFHSYIVYFLAVILGVIFDQIFSHNIFSGVIYQYIGFGMIILGSLLVYWAQSVTYSPKKKNETTRDVNFFLKGPYKYTRNPTNLGITIMSLGLGILINSLFSVVFIVITYLIARFLFIKKQDSILKKKYGEVFDDYKKKVKDWL